MIFDYYKAIFLHSGRTGGTSIELALSPSFIAELQLSNGKPNREVMFGWDPELKIYLQHASAETLFQLMGERIKEYFIFSVVRNPYSRLRSVYAYQYQGFKDRFGDFKGFVLALPQLLSHANNSMGSHFLPQASYTKLRGSNICDLLIKFEDLTVGYAELKASLGINGELPKINANAYPDDLNMPLAKLYDQEMIEVMNSMYHEDFSEFNYALNPM